MDTSADNRRESGGEPERGAGSGRFQAGNAAGLATRFRAGRSGNPKGRPPGVARAARKLIGKNGERALQFLTDLMDGKALPVVIVGPDGAPEAVDTQVPGVRERRHAAIELLNRACGKATQPVELSGPGGGPIRTASELALYTDEELELAAQIARRAEERAAAASRGGADAPPDAR